MEDDVKDTFSPGDTVWARIPNFPWWPAEVVSENDYPAKTTPNKTLVAVVKFFNEDYPYQIRSRTKIQKFLIPDFMKLKQKGENDKRESLRSNFVLALQMAMEKEGVSEEDAAVETSQQDSLDSVPDEDLHTSVLTETVELVRSSRKRKVDKNISKEYENDKDIPKEKKKCTLSTKTMTSTEQVSTTQDSPSIPYPWESADTSGVVSRLFVHNSREAVKRCLEEELSSTADMGTAESNQAPAESLGLQCPSPLHGTKSIGQCLRRKFLSDRFTDLVKGGNVSSGVDDADSLDTLGKDPKEDISTLQQLPVFSRCSSSVSSYDSNLDSEASDSDELPEGLSPSVADTKGMPEVRDVVWVKYKRFPYWPAVVRRIQYGKRKGPKKVQVQFLGATGHFKEIFYITYRRDIILPFECARRREFEEAGRQCEKESKRFVESLNEVEAYLNKKALGLLPPNKEDSFFDEDYESNLSETLTPDETPEVEVTRTETTEIQPRLTNKKPSERNLDNMKEKRKRKNQILLEFMLSEEMKTYLMDIFNKKRKSERHTQYHSSVRERDKLRHSGFGPIADEDQQDQITYTFVEWYKEVAAPADIDYILDVWVPEAIVYSLIKMKRYARSRAWEHFSKGCRLSKVEQKQLHQHLIRTARNISAADTHRYNERLQERFDLVMNS